MAAEKANIKSKNVWDISKVVNNDLKPYWKYIAEEYNHLKEELVAKFAAGSGVHDVEVELFGQPLKLKMEVSGVGKNSSITYYGENSYNEVLEVCRNKVRSIQSDSLLEVHLKPKLNTIDADLHKRRGSIFRANRHDDYYLVYTYKTDGEKNEKLKYSVNAISDKESKFITKHLSEKYKDRFFGEVSKDEFIKCTKDLFPKVSTSIDNVLSEAKLADRYYEKYKAFIEDDHYNIDFTIHKSKENPELGNLYFKVSIPENNVKGHVNYRVVKRDVILDHEPVERLQKILEQIEGKIDSSRPDLKTNSSIERSSYSKAFKGQLSFAIDVISEFIKNNKDAINDVHFAIVSGAIKLDVIAQHQKATEPTIIYSSNKPLYDYKKEKDTRSPGMYIDSYLKHLGVNYHGVFNLRKNFECLMAEHYKIDEKPLSIMKLASVDPAANADVAKKITDNDSHQK
jgi:hypothetical protein